MAQLIGTMLSSNGVKRDHIHIRKAPASDITSGAGAADSDCLLRR